MECGTHTDREAQMGSSSRAAKLPSTDARRSEAHPGCFESAAAVVKHALQYSMKVGAF